MKMRLELMRQLQAASSPQTAPWTQAMLAALRPCSQLLHQQLLITTQQQRQQLVHSQQAVRHSHQLQQNQTTQSSVRQRTRRTACAEL